MPQPIAIPEGRHESLVYFIRLGTRVKIGVTTHLAARITALSLAPRFVILTMEGDRSLEAALHNLFADEREQGTEWFAYSKRLAAYIREHQEGQPNRFALSEGEAVQQAERIVLETRIASASMLKRKMRISWTRAKSLMAELERRGIVGPLEGPGCTRAVLARRVTKVSA
ncbi:DNA translocase FtsK [Streptomyces sp. NPDC086023]|uniref:DNA translocase FtsK n=1 Tax=Streptomyces sp. NPDC086023 TaxID=3365746 RepID=UPI0037D1E9D8